MTGVSTEGERVGVPGEPGPGALDVNGLPGHDPNSAQLWLVTPSTPPKLLADAVGPGIIERPRLGILTVEVGL